MKLETAIQVAEEIASEADAVSPGDAAGAFLMLTSMLFVGGLAGALALRGSAAARVGTILHVERAGHARRSVILALLALLALAAILVPGAPTVSALAVLLIAGALVQVTPAPADTAVGEDGVRAGWEAARYDELAEWRLTGEHLRWRKSEGVWVASQLPTELHVRVRERLERVVPERESGFAR